MLHVRLRCSSLNELQAGESPSDKSSGFHVAASEREEKEFSHNKLASSVTQQTCVHNPFYNFFVSELHFSFAGFWFYCFCSMQHVGASFAPFSRGTRVAKVDFGVCAKCYVNAVHLSVTHFLQSPICQAARPLARWAAFAEETIGRDLHQNFPFLDRDGNARVDQKRHHAGLHVTRNRLPTIAKWSRFGLSDHKDEDEWCKLKPSSTRSRRITADYLWWWESGQFSNAIICLFISSRFSSPSNSSLGSLKASSRKCCGRVGTMCWLEHNMQICKFISAADRRKKDI